MTTDCPQDRQPLLRRMFDAAIAAAQPALCLPPQLPVPPKGRTVVIGAGKASAAMATTCRASTSRPCRPRTRCRTLPGWRLRNACGRW